MPRVVQKVSVAHHVHLPFCTQLGTLLWSTILALLLSLATASAACVADQVELSIAPLEQGTFSNNQERDFLVISSQHELDTLYRAVHSGQLPSKRPPKVNFQTHLVLVAFMGSRTSTGYLISFTESAVISNGTAQITVIEDQPPPGAVVGAAMTSPYAAAQVARGGYDSLVFLDRHGNVLQRFHIQGAPQP